MDFKKTTRSLESATAKVRQAQKMADELMNKQFCNLMWAMGLGLMLPLLECYKCQITGIIKNIF